MQHWLSPGEQVELRQLLAHENPNMADADWDALVKFGLLMVGAYVLLRALGGRS